MREFFDSLVTALFLAILTGIMAFVFWFTSTNRYEITYQCDNKIITERVRADRHLLGCSAPFYILITNDEYMLVKEGIFIGSEKPIYKSKDEISIISISLLKHRFGKLPCQPSKTEDLRTKNQKAE